MNVLKPCASILQLLWAFNDTKKLIWMWVKTKSRPKLVEQGLSQGEKSV